jgi:hypothetical protein
VKAETKKQNIPASVKRDKRLADRWPKLSPARQKALWPTLTESQRVSCLLGVPSLDKCVDDGDFWPVVRRALKAGRSVNAAMQRKGWI